MNLRDEFVSLMRELKELNPAEYRRLMDEAWAAAARSHEGKCPEQRTKWARGAS